MLLSAEKITKSYGGGKPLLNNISLYLHEGDKIGVIGINGTGKSTFLNILAQCEDPDSGAVTRNQGVRIEYLRQNPVWNDSLTILEHVFLGTSSVLRETKEYEAKTILTKLGFADFDKPVQFLSGGQRRRVAIAAALVHPCSGGLDHTQRHRRYRFDRRINDSLLCKLIRIWAGNESILCRGAGKYDCLLYRCRSRGARRDVIYNERFCH